MGSAAFHVILAAAVIWALAVPAPPDEVGLHVQSVLTQDVFDIEEPDLLEPLEEPIVEELELPEIPVLPEDVPLEPEETLEPLDEAVIPERVPELSLTLVSERVTPEQDPVMRPVPPPPPVVSVPRVRPRRAVAAPRPVARERLRPVYAPRHYPEGARKRGLQGRTKVAVTVSASGSVIDARVIVSSGYDVLDSAALATARQWRFAPPGTLRRAVLPFLFDLNRG